MVRLNWRVAFRNAFFNESRQMARRRFNARALPAAQVQCLEQRTLLAATIIDTNFNSGVPSNAHRIGTAVYRSSNTDVMLTNGVTQGQTGSLYVDSTGARALAFNARLFIYAGGDTSGGDGYSFGYGNLSGSPFGETGEISRSGVWISVDTFVGTSATGTIKAYYNGAQVGTTATFSRAQLAPEGRRTLNFSVSEAGILKYSHNALLERTVSLVGWNPAANWRFGVGAATGEAVDIHVIDELSIFDTTPNHAPTNIVLSGSSVAENLSGATVGNLSTTDQDELDTFSYSLVSGAGSTDNSSFQIVGSNLRTATSLNYEAGSTRSVRVRSTDQGGLFTERAFTISVINVNEAPTALALSSSSIAENQPSGTGVGTLTTTDPDVGNTFNYTLVSGTGSADNSSFTIAGDTLRTAASFDFETKSSYAIRVRVTDAGGLTFDEVFTISVTNETELGGIDVQDGQTQRSYLRALDVIFDQPNGLMDVINNNRLQLTRFDLNGLNGSLMSLPTRTVVGNNIRFDFGVQGIGGDRNTNVGDGYYELGVDMDGNGSFESKKYFHRLLGDATGDGKVDASDKTQVLSASGTSSAESDVNGDGLVNIRDTIIASRAVGRKLKSSLFRDD